MSWHHRNLAIALIILLFCAPLRGLSWIAILPDGRTIAPAGFGIPVNDFPSQVVLAPDKKAVVVLEQTGWSGAGFDVVTTTLGGRIEEHVDVPDASRLLWTSDTLYVACGYDGTIARFRYTPGKSVFGAPSFVREPDFTVGNLTLLTGLADDPVHHRLYVARTADHEIAVFDERTGTIIENLKTTGEPFGVVLADGILFATMYNGTVVNVWRNATGIAQSIVTGDHPTELLADRHTIYIANADGHDVAVIDTRTLHVERHIPLSFDASEPPGRTPSGMALSENSKQLFVAESGMNDVADIDLTTGKVIERIPTGWYPMSVAATSNTSLNVAAQIGEIDPNTPVTPNITLWIASAKGYGSQADPAGEWDGSYSGLVQHVMVGSVPSKEYAFPTPLHMRNVESPLPPIRHIVFIVKENKHFDEEFGDFPGADADPRLVLYGKHYTPNAHTLAARYVLFDRFLSDGEESIFGHSWTTHGWVNDYQERNANMSGANFRLDATSVVPVSIWPWPEPWVKNVSDADDDADWYQDLSMLPKQPRINVSGVFGPRGELIDELQRKHISFRVYGEQMTMLPDGSIAPGLAHHADTEYPGTHVDFNILDTQRARLFLKDVAQHGLATYSYLTLPTDHTAGVQPGFYLPQSYIADNDLALGQIIEGLSKRPEWRTTIVFVTTDDPQGTGDHYDSHRMPALMIGPYARQGFVDHTRYDQDSILRTVEVMFHLDPLSIHDESAVPILDAFAKEPQMVHYQARPAEVPIVREPGIPRQAFVNLDGPEWRDLPNQEWVTLRGSRSFAEHLEYLASLTFMRLLAGPEFLKTTDDDERNDDT